MSSVRMCSNVQSGDVSQQPMEPNCKVNNNTPVQKNGRGGRHRARHNRVSAQAPGAPQGTAANIHCAVEREWNPEPSDENRRNSSTGPPNKDQVKRRSSNPTRGDPNGNAASSQAGTTPLQPRRLPDTKGKAPTSKNMSISSDSDEIVFTKAKGKQNGQGALKPKPQDNRRRSSRWSQRGMSSNHSAKDTNDKPFKTAPQSALEELKQLQQKVVTQAHLNRFSNRDIPEAHPEFLSLARKGPGMDPDCEIYQEVEKRRQAPGWGIVHDTASPSELSDADSKFDSDLVFEDPVISFPPEKYNAQRILYKRSPPAYPKIENGETALSPEPIPGHEYTPNSPRNSDIKSILESQASGLQVSLSDNHWTDAFFAEWENRSEERLSNDVSKDRFMRWLDSTLRICCKVDIYHKAFFDGTAHPDGEQSLLIPDIRFPTAPLDLDDEANRLHGLETVESYCYNLQLHIKKNEQVEDIRKKAAREAYLQAANPVPPPSSKAPVANVYLRPVENGDIPELLEVFNWYIESSTLKADIDPYGAADVRQHIEDCRREKLPFLVAAERRTGMVGRNDAYDRERILGYARATDFVGQRTTGRFTAELELFVRNDEKRRGIGKSLIDKLLEVCDAAHKPQRGYFFNSSPEDRSRYTPGGHRKLARLVFVYSYPKNKSHEYDWVKNWLQNYRFKEQGIFEGFGVKNDQFLNFAYLVRNVGPSDESFF